LKATKKFLIYLILVLCSTLYIVVGSVNSNQAFASNTSTSASNLSNLQALESPYFISPQVLTKANDSHKHIVMPEWLFEIEEEDEVSSSANSLKNPCKYPISSNTFQSSDKLLSTPFSAFQIKEEVLYIPDLNILYQVNRS
jgi:hypothetical protein